MTLKPLDQIGLLDHLSALWWLGLLYRKPMAFQQGLEGLQRWRALRTGLMVYLHALPYMLLIAAAGRWLLFDVLGLELQEHPLAELPDLIWHGTLLLRGIAIGIALKIFFGISGVNLHGFPRGIAGGLAFGTIYGTTFGIVLGIDDSVVFGAALGIAYGIVKGVLVGCISIAYFFGIIFEIAFFGIFFGVTFGLVFGMIDLNIGYEIAYVIAGGIALFRAYYWPFTILFVWPTLKPYWYPYHPVAWDDLCSLSFPRMDQLLAAYAEADPKAGSIEISRLIDHYPSQRMAALRAQIRFIARKAGRETRLSRLDAIVANLPEGEKSFLARTRPLRAKVGEISQLQSRLDTQDRPFLREPTAALLCEKIKNFQNQIAGYPEPLSSEFRQASAKWLEIAEREYQKTQRILNNQPNPQVFRAGDPVDRGKEAFVPRESVLGELDRQLTLSTGCPGLILYARRRMGKSTLLHNLDGFLPTSTRTVVISMQNPDAFTTQADFFNLVGRELLNACPEAPIILSLPEQAEALAEKGAAITFVGRGTSGLVNWQVTPLIFRGISNLPDFFKLLETCNASLKQSDSRLLLAIDEYENIDVKLGQGVFTEDLLSALRESIQYHRHIIWAFAGSRSIEELTHAPWPSYLISARTLEIPPFSEAETRRLLTEPLRYSPLWDKGDPRRPRFEPGFWGEGGIECIHREAGGWPHLVQLLAETSVDLSNDRGLSAVDADLLEQAIQKAVTLGDTVLRQLLKGEASEPEWAYINGFRRKDTQPPPEYDAVYRGLRRRLLVEEAGNGEWRLRVPLMRRWLRERG